MKKIFIYLFLCLLCLSSFGQGTAYITQSDLVGYPEIIRQYDNLPGNHVIYYKDAPSGIKGYVGLTDVYNNITYSQVVRDCIVKDLEVLGDWAFFCGYTVNTNKALIGWFDIHELASGNGVSPFIDSSSFTPPPPSTALQSIENIEVYIGPIHVMRSMSLSDSNMYVLYGQKAVGGANAFCKDYQYVTSVSCLSSDILEFELAPIIPDDRLEFNRTSSPSYLNPFPLPTQYDPSGVVIRTICH